MRGGGAHYLAEVASPQSYVATDVEEEHLARCRELCNSRDRDASAAQEPLRLRFERADAAELAAQYPGEAFDMVLCVQAAALFSDTTLRRFVAGAEHVLRHGGCLALCDLLAPR